MADSDLNKAIEEVVRKVVQEEVRTELQNGLSKALKDSMPDLDAIIAEKVKDHIFEIGKHMMESVKEPQEEDSK